MKGNAIFIITAVSLLAVFTSCKPTPSDNSDYLITNVNVVDVESGEINANQSVAISGEKITAIYAEKVNAGDSTTVIDGTGKYLIPGLWDMHTHYNSLARPFTPLMIANGVIGLREMWGTPDTIKSLRRQIADGEMLGPEIYSAGSIIDGTPPIWPGSSGVENAEKAIEEVRKQVAQGMDFLKVYSLLSRESYFAIVEEAKKNNIPFAGHIPESITMWEAMEAGQQSVEHLYRILEACTSKPEEFESDYADKGFSSPEKSDFLVDTFDKEIFDSLAVVLANSDTWLSPTLVVLRNISNLDDSTFREDPRNIYIPSFFDAFWQRGASRSKEHFEAARKKFDLHLSLMGDFEKAGVKILAGTDYPNPYCYPGFSLHDELELMVQGGMTVEGALKTATINAALFTGKEAEFGTVDEGKVASLVLLNDNPLTDIINVRKIESVFLRGKLLPRGELDEMLKGAEQQDPN